MRIDWVACAKLDIDFELLKAVVAKNFFTFLNIYISNVEVFKMSKFSKPFRRKFFFVDFIKNSTD